MKLSTCWTLRTPWIIRLSMGVHVVLVSLFGRPTVWSIFHFFGRAQENCPVSKTRKFLFVQSFLKIGHSLISRLDKKNYVRGQQKMTCLWDWTIFFWPTKKWEINRTIGLSRRSALKFQKNVFVFLAWFWYFFNCQIHNTVLNYTACATKAWPVQIIHNVSKLPFM